MAVLAKANSNFGDPTMISLNESQWMVIMHVNISQLFIIINSHSSIMWWHRCSCVRWSRSCTFLPELLTSCASSCFQACPNDLTPCRLSCVSPLLRYVQSNVLCIRDFCFRPVTMYLLALPKKFRPAHGHYIWLFGSVCCICLRQSPIVIWNFTGIKVKIRDKLILVSSCPLKIAKLVQLRVFCCTLS